MTKKKTMMTVLVLLGAVLLGATACRRKYAFASHSYKGCDRFDFL